MMRRFMLLVLVATGVLSGTASAEVCDASGRFCIVNPPTAASPWVAPQVVQLRLPAEANPEYSGAKWTQAGVLGGEYPSPLGHLQLLTAGPPGGTSLYQAVLEPEVKTLQEGNVFVPADGTMSLTLVAAHSDHACQCIAESSATFDQLPILGTISGFTWRIVHRGKFYRAVMSFTARLPVQVKQLFHISGFTGDKVDIGHVWVTRRSLEAGPQRVVQKLSTRYVNRHCAPFPRCVLFAEGSFGLPFVNSELMWPLERPIPRRHLPRAPARLRRPAAPDSLSLDVKQGFVEKTAKQLPGRSLYGRLTTERPACRGGRLLYASFESPPHGSGPVIQPMYSGARNHNNGVKTDGHGSYHSAFVPFYRRTRVVALVKAERRSGQLCPAVESAPRILAAQPELVP